MWKPGFPYYGENVFLVLTMSLQECDVHITQIKKRFETDMQLDADSKPATPVIPQWDRPWAKAWNQRADAGI